MIKEVSSLKLLCNDDFSYLIVHLKPISIGRTRMAARKAAKEAAKQRAASSPSEPTLSQILPPLNNPLNKPQIQWPRLDIDTSDIDAS